MPICQSVFGDGLVPFPYGAYSIESMDACGGWIRVGDGPGALLRCARGSAPTGIVETRDNAPDPGASAIACRAEHRLRIGVACEPGRNRADALAFRRHAYSTSSDLVQLPGGISVALLFNGTGGRSAYFNDISAVAATVLQMRIGLRTTFTPGTMRATRPRSTYRRW